MTTAIGGRTAATIDIATAAEVDHSLTRFQASTGEQQAEAHDREAPPQTSAQPLALQPADAASRDALVPSSRLHSPTGATPRPSAALHDKDLGYRNVGVGIAAVCRSCVGPPDRRPEGDSGGLAGRHGADV